MAAPPPPAPPGVIHWGDVPVPYVAAWSSETEVRIERDPLMQGRHALFRGGRRGDSRPIFGQMDEARVRRVVIEERCQVCTRFLKGDGYVIDVPYATHGGHPLVREPLACLKCFKISIARCPGIERMRANPKALSVRVRRYVPIWVTLTVAEGGDELLNHLLAHWKGPAVVGYVRPALVDYEPTPMVADG